MANDHIKRSNQGQSDCVSVPWHEMEKMGIKRDDPMAVQHLLQMYDELKRTKKEKEETKKRLQSDLDAKNEKAKTDQFLQKVLIGCAEIRTELQESTFRLRNISAILLVFVIYILFLKT